MLRQLSKMRVRRIAIVHSAKVASIGGTLARPLPIDYSQRKAVSEQPSA